MARNGTFDSKRAEARELFEAGLSCRAIAEKLDVAPSTISRWAKAEGLKFDRSQTDLATRAHAIDMAADRLELAQMMLVAARDGLAELDGPVTVFNFGGKDNTFKKKTLDRAPMSMRREAMTTAGIAFDKATRVVEKSDTGLDVAVGVLDTIAAVASAAAEQYRESATDED